VGDLADMGYLPEGARNYLARLGWAHGDAEIFTDEEAISWFDVAQVNRSPARLDWDKLNFVNAHHLRRAEDDRLARLVEETLLTRGEALDEEASRRIRLALPLVKERAKTVVELAEQLAFALKSRPLALDAKTHALLSEETRSRLSRLKGALENEQEFSLVSLETALKTFAETEGVGMGKFGPALRGVLAGGAPAPGLAETLAALGREEALGRLHDALTLSA
jgi:glutamyl-tRNA synthetase